MTTRTSETVDISFYYETEMSGVFVDPGGWIPITVRVEDSYVCGTGDPSEGVVGEGGYVLSELLDSVDLVKNGEEAVIEFSYSPYWLVVQPVDGETVGIHGSGTYEGISDPSKRLKTDQSAEISKSAWREEVVETTETFVETVINSNPELQSHELLQTLSRKVSEL